ncbi:hypothetical protein EV702DRAFT_983016 [Suillus placidus]|uniref:Uncharacterized protein n=1 Tax=Suillus placidus TaxID=48579 RepID=A0A9P7CVB4_9AGAM|nr:hypothetical protein EV702DRAFT_983016 [Suillus placidus]
MGINHPVLASFLCPISALADFNRDPILARKWMEIGRIRMTSIDFPTFLWAGNPPGSRYNEDMMSEGLFQGYFLERVSVSIDYMRPSTPLGDDSRATRSCNASLHDMTTVEAEHIAYACVQATPVNGLAKMRAQMANRANAAKRPATPDPNPIPTPPQSSVTPDPPPIMHSPTPGPSVPPKSPATSELTPNEALSNNDDSDDVSAIKKGKKKMPKARGKTKRPIMQESEDDNDNEPAKPTKGRPRAKRASHRRK